MPSCWHFCSTCDRSVPDGSFARYCFAVSKSCAAHAYVAVKRYRRVLGLHVAACSAKASANFAYPCAYWVAAFDITASMSIVSHGRSPDVPFGCGSFRGLSFRGLSLRGLLRSVTGSGGLASVAAASGTTAATSAASTGTTATATSLAPASANATAIPPSLAPCGGFGPPAGCPPSVIAAVTAPPTTTTAAMPSQAPSRRLGGC